MQVLRSLRRGPAAGGVPLPDGLHFEDASLSAGSGQVDVEGTLGVSPVGRMDRGREPPVAAAAADLFSLSLSHPNDSSRGRGQAGSDSPPPSSAVSHHHIPDQAAEEQWLYRDPKGEVQVRCAHHCSRTFLPICIAPYHSACSHHLVWHRPLASCLESKCWPAKLSLNGIRCGAGQT